MSDDVTTGPSPFERLLGRRGARPCKVVAWPGDPDVRVALYACTHLEASMAEVEAVRYLMAPAPKGLGLTEIELVHLPDHMETETQIRKLLVSLRDADNPNMPLFFDAATARKHLEPAERQALWNEVAAFQAERAPITRARTPAEFEGIIAALSKEPTATSTLISCDIDTLRSCLRYAASQLASATRPSSSP